MKVRESEDERTYDTSRNGRAYRIIERTARRRYCRALRLGADPTEYVEQFRSALEKKLSEYKLRAECVKEAQQWQPIETAPKDGTEIIIHAIKAVWIPLPPSPNATGKE